MSDAPARAPDGRWLPGKSAHPGGRPALPQNFRRAGTEYLELFDAIARDKDHPDQVKALIWCLERIYGKAAPVLEVSDGDGEVEPVVAVLLQRAKRGAEWERVVETIEGELAAPAGHEDAE